MFPFRSFMIRLDFDEVKGLFLAERRSGLARGRPVADGERRALAFSAEDLPIIGNANGGFRLGVGGICFRGSLCATSSGRTEVSHLDSMCSRSAAKARQAR